MIRFLVGLLFVFSCSMNSPVFACCMLPETYRGTISQNDHEAVIVHRAGRQELVLRINYKIIGDTMPDQFAWVITVPNEPDNYKIANPQLFEDMFFLPFVPTVFTDFPSRPSRISALTFARLRPLSQQFSPCTLYFRLLRVVGGIDRGNRYRRDTVVWRFFNGT